VADLLVWIDCEMTGLDLGKDKLIEVAALVTDPDLNVLGEGVDLVIHADDAALDAMPTVVRDMHAKSGLTEEVRRSTVTMAEAEEPSWRTSSQFVPNPRTAPLCGNSIATDRGFLARDMPALDDVPALPDDRRLLDQGAVPPVVSAGLLRPAAKGLAHRALADIRESIRELEYYRRTVFVPLPGPDVDRPRRSPPSCRHAPRR
jgi:oligoribonuclease